MRSERHQPTRLRRLWAPSALTWLASLFAVTAHTPALAASPPAPDQPPEARGPSVTFTPERGLHVSIDDDTHWFQLQTAVWVRAQLEAPDGDDITYSASVPLVRPVFQSSLFDGLVQTFIQPEFSGQARLLDASIDLNVSPAFRIRAGVFRLPYSRAFITPILNLSLPGRGVVSDTFRLGRGTGVMFFGRALGGRLEYNVSAAMTALTGGAATLDPVVIARLSYAIGDILPYDQVPTLRGWVAPSAVIALSGAFQRESAPGGDEVFRGHGSLDVTFAAGPFSMTSEAFLRATEGDEWTYEWGVFLQAGVFVAPQLLELVARGSWLDRLDRPEEATYEAGLNLYVPTPTGTLGHHTKLQLGYAFTKRDAEAADSHALTLQLQAAF